MMIKMNDICFAYEDEPILNYFSFEVEKGEIVALKGANGCGKSTILKIINGLLFAENGEYYFDGKLIDKKTLGDKNFSKLFHQKIGYVFQNSDSQLFCNSVYDEIAFAPTQMGLSEAEIKQRAEDMIKLFDLEKLKSRPPYHLSSGEKKRVAFASVMSANPEVLVLDEPLSGLDEKTQKWLTSFILSMKKAGKTIVVVTHNNDFALTVSDRIVNM